MKLKLLTVALSLLLLIGAAIGTAWQQGPRPVPAYPGDGNPQHDGQPEFCINSDTKEFLHNCDCQPRMGDKECHDQDRGGENPKCSVYCRRRACRCERMCGKTE